MPVPVDHARALVAQGLAFVCSLCERFWEGRDQGLSVCTAVAGCRGPIGGGAFHEYKGPLTNLESWCFRCGTSATATIEVPGGVQRIGVCRVHLKDLPNWASEIPSNKVLVIHNAGLVSVHNLTRKQAPPRKTPVLDILREFEEDSKKR